MLNFVVSMNSALYATLHYPRTHHSKIPSFQDSNWGEALNFYYDQGFC